MLKLTVNLRDSLTAANRRALAKDIAVLDRQIALDRETDKLIDKALDRATEVVEEEKTAVMRTLGLDYKISEAQRVHARHQKWKHLPQDRIFSNDAIKALCIRYDLRFL